MTNSEPHWQENQKAFNSFLRWLNPDQSQAIVTYARIQNRLAKIFECHGYSNCEQLANRVVQTAVADIEEDFYIQSGSWSKHLIEIVYKIIDSNDSAIPGNDILQTIGALFSGGPKAEENNLTDVDKTELSDLINEYLSQLNEENSNMLKQHFVEINTVTIQNGAPDVSEEVHKLRNDMIVYIQKKLNS